MILKKIPRIIIKKPELQYPFYWLVGFFKQLKYLLSDRNISYSGVQPFLFIVGAGRSGNTLLRRLLMERGDIYIPPESYVFAQEVKTHLNTCALSWNDKVELTLGKFEYYPEFTTFELNSLREFAVYAKTFGEEKQQIGTLIVEFYQWLAEKNGLNSLWLGDKTPVNTMHLGLIHKLIPGAVYIYIERDGVDVCSSYIRAGIYNNISDAAHRWRDSRHAWQAFKKKIKNDSYLEVSYENLVNDHNKILTNILNSLKIPEKKSLIRVADNLGDVSIRKHHCNVMKSPNLSSIGKGRRLINESERHILRKIIGDDLINAGYKAI